MGAEPCARRSGEQQPVYPYAFGYKDPASNLFRTVMAYNCPVSGCPRILYFSNPGVSYGGRATGTFERHDNALTLNNTHTVVANFRQTVKPGLGAPQSLTRDHVGHHRHVGVDASRFRRGDGLCHRSGLRIRAREPCPAADWCGNVTGRAGAVAGFVLRCACAPAAPMASAHRPTRFSC